MAWRALSILLLLLLVVAAPPGLSSSGGPLRSIEIEARKYAFKPARIEVTHGDAVRLTIRSADTKHGFGIEALGIDEEIPRRGRPVTIEFVAHAVGEFQIKCTEWCGNGHKRMIGTLVVHPRETVP